MQKLYEKLNKLIDLICFSFIYLSGFYGVIWLYCAVNLPSSWIYNSIINFLPSIVKSFSNPYIANGDKQVDMSFLIVAFVFFLLYFVALYFVRWTDSQAYQCELHTIEERKRIEDIVNKELEVENQNSVMQYKSAIALIKLNFNYLVDPNIIEEKLNVSEIEKKSYTKLIANTNFPYHIIRGKADNQAYFILDQFYCVEHFIMTMLKVMKSIYKENIKNDIKTTFHFTLDALKRSDDFQEELKNLVKISSFHYTNKVIVTLPFVRRYESKENRVFEFYTMGTSRYFEKIEGNSANPARQFKTQDFELYYIRFNKDKKI